MKPIPYGRQEITDADVKAVTDVLRSDFLTQGPLVEEFEKKIAQFVGASYAVAVTNGTAALHLAALALKVKPGQKVLCTTNSFVASSNCVEYCGGQVELVDIDPKTLCLDVKQVEAKIKSAPPGTYQGVVTVDFAGLPSELEKLSQICRANKMWLLEDACHAFGAQLTDSTGKTSFCGNGQFADISVFSFHPVKHIATGEGGALTTNSKEIYDRLKMLRSHGITKDPQLLKKNDGPWYQEMQMLGFNYRISDILCALGLSQLQRIETNLKKRQAIADRYFAELKNLPLVLPQVASSQRHAWHLFVVQADKRDQLFQFLREHQINPQVHYVPIHQQPYYIEKYGVKSLPVAEAYYHRALSLPMYHGLSAEDQSYVIETLKKFF